MNAGDSKTGRMKAAITKRTKAGIKPPKSGMAAAPPTPFAPTKISETVTNPPNVPQTKPYKGRFKFLGSMKQGGTISRTGLWLMHKGERVHNPALRKAKGLVK